MGLWHKHKQDGINLHETTIGMLIFLCLGFAFIMSRWKIPSLYLFTCYLVRNPNFIFPSNDVTQQMRVAPINCNVFASNLVTIIGYARHMCD